MTFMILQKKSYFKNAHKPFFRNYIFKRQVYSLHCVSSTIILNMKTYMFKKNFVENGDLIDVTSRELYGSAVKRQSWEL